MTHPHDSGPSRAAPLPLDYATPTKRRSRLNVRIIAPPVLVLLAGIFFATHPAALGPAAVVLLPVLSIAAGVIGLLRARRHTPSWLTALAIIGIAAGFLWLVVVGALAWALFHLPGI